MQFHWDFYRDYINGYLKDVGILAFGIFVSISGLATLFIEPVMRISFSSQQWISLFIGIFIASVILAQGIIHYKIARRVVTGERVEELLKAIGQLREEGILLQNKDVTTIQTIEDLRLFRAKFDDWHGHLIPKVQELSPSQASIFQVLGTFKTNLNVGDSNPIQLEATRLKNIITEYTDRIKDMVDKFSLENLHNRISN